MAHPPGPSVIVVILYLCAPPAYGDTIYTCASRNGVPLLQNMPCDTGSELSVQKDVREAKSAPLPPGAAPAAVRAPAAADASSIGAGKLNRREAQNAASHASGATTDTAAARSDDLANLPTEPEVGMTQKQVRAILGAPTAITQEEASQGIEMTWIYDDSRILQFDASGRLSKK
jgi:hypothetical protein